MTTSAVLAALFLGSFFHINLGPEVKPPVSYEIPPAYVRVVSADEIKQPEAETVRPDTPWWTYFNEPVLNGCIEEAFRNNRDLEAALAKVQQARAVFKENRANQRPEIGGQVDTSRSYLLGNADGRHNETDLWYGLGTANYEADLWGRLQKATRAAKENILATEAAKNSVRLALASQVAKTYFSLRGTDNQLAVAQRTLLTETETVNLNRIKYEHGQINELDLRRSEAAAASTEAKVRELEMALSKYENSLLVLMGREPKDFIARDIPRGVAIDKMPEPPVIPSGLPADLLKQRPDVKQAEQNYKVALANLGSARAGQYPTLSFNGLIGTPADDLSYVFTGATGWSLASQVFAPFFDGGKRSSKVKQAEAAAQQAWSVYYKTVQTAFEETLNSLTARDKTLEILGHVKTQESAQSRAYDLAKIQYDEGYTSQLDLLDAERQLLSVQLQLEQTRADRLNAVVDLCTALGGGWAWKAEDDIEYRELQKPWKNPVKFSE